MSNKRIEDEQHDRWPRDHKVEDNLHIAYYDRGTDIHHLSPHARVLLGFDPFPGLSGR